MAEIQQGELETRNFSKTMGRGGNFLNFSGYKESPDGLLSDWKNYNFTKTPNRDLLFLDFTKTQNVALNKAFSNPHCPKHLEKYRGAAL